MAEWVSHLIVADRVLEKLPWLKKHEFCVGNIAPDCNTQNADGSFTPSREITHWMGQGRKNASDCVRFCNEYIIKRSSEIKTDEEMSFLMGYYTHLITDAELQRTIRDEQRVAAAWERAKKIPELLERSAGMEENWDNFKKLLLDRKDRLRDFLAIEKEYLDEHPDSGYLTEIKDLTEFPTYIDYLSDSKAALQKVKQVYYTPLIEERKYPFLAFTREEYLGVLDRAVELSVEALKKIREE